MSVQPLASDAQDRNGPADGWSDFVNGFGATNSASKHQPWGTLFDPLRRGSVDEFVVVGQIGQSLDGRIATESGHSKYINGPAGLAHLHRLRALVDAVVIGVGTAIIDDPQLTVRHVTGAHPARVVIDPKGRLSPEARVLHEDGVRRLVISTPSLRGRLPPSVEVVTLDAGEGGFAPADILKALATRGLRRILVEGGAHTVSRFLDAGCLDRLHVLVAPIILGAGPCGFSLPPIERPDQAMRIKMHAHQIGDEILFDCDLSDFRIPVGSAKKSK
jgi:riboflavin-specific deaminase-like protein